MTLTLTLTPEKETRLQRQAAQAGLPLDEYVQRLVEMAAGEEAGDDPMSNDPMSNDPMSNDPMSNDPMSNDPMPAVPAAVQAARFLRWAGSHGMNTPLLSEEAISREAMYEDTRG